MRLRDLSHTTGVRHALLFLALFAASSALLFSFLYHNTAGYLKSDVDDWLTSRLAIFVEMSESELIERLNNHVDVDPANQRPFTLFDDSGQRIAGNAVTLPMASPPIDGLFEFEFRQNGESALYRGLAHRLPSGDLLLVARDVEEMNEFVERLVGAMASGGMIVLVIGLIGAAIAGAGTLRRIDAVTKAIERIVKGDLSERLPTHGTSGDLNRLVIVVNGMLDEIERLMHEIKGVSDNIAHDLRTPLTRLLAGLERGHRRANSVNEYAATVSEAINETKVVLATFAAMLRIAEVEDGARRAGFTTVDLATVATDVMELYEPFAEVNGISLSLETDGHDAIALRGDPSLLFEAIGNLVDNAIKFTPSGGAVTVRIFQEKTRLGVAVSDTGPGIPVDKREAVLQRFYRIEKGRTTPGSGLGLALVAAVARLHGLQLTIEDASPGCRVTLWTNGNRAGNGVAPVGDGSAAAAGSVAAKTVGDKA
jgi:signal transduction histidine kinase